MKGRKGDLARLEHIFAAILEIEEYVRNRNFSDFSTNSMFRFACIKQLEIIGEASNHISLETQNEFTEIQWAQIVGMRNIFIHEYFGIDARIIWDAVRFELPALKASRDLQTYRAV